MRRRDFITLLGGTAVFWPLAARAQQRGLPVVAFINGGAADTMADLAGAFSKGLTQAGYTDAVLTNPTNAPSAEAAANELRKSGPTLGLEILLFNASTAAEIDAAFAAFARERPDALFIAADGFFASRKVQLATLAVRDRMPASFVSRAMVEAGLLMSYGTIFTDTFRQVGIYAGSILNGAKPADLPVLQSTKFEFVINLQTARSLGLDIPPILLAQADEVIE